MPISINGTGSITGLSAGGLPDASVTAADLASGAARSNFGAGAVLQVVSTAKTNLFSTTSSSYVDVTGLSASITPSSTSSKIYIIAHVMGGIDSANAGAIKLVRDSTDILLGDTSTGYVRTTVGNFYQGSDSNNAKVLMVAYLDSPSSTSSLTYKIQVAAIQGSGTVNINANGADLSGQSYSIRGASTITVMEIAG